MIFTNRQMRRHPELFMRYAPDGEEGAGGGVAVLDKPAEGLESGSAEDRDAAVDANDSTPDNVVEGEVKDETPAKSALDPETQALIDAARAEEREAIARDNRTAEQKKADEEAENAHLEALRTHYTTHEKNLTEALDAIGVNIAGESYRLDQPTKDKLTGILKAYEADAAASIGLRLRDTLTRQVLATVPEDDREAVKKRLDGADPKAFAAAIGEEYAPRAESLKGLDLEGVLKVSAKAKREHLEALKVAKNEAKLAERKRISELHGITLDEPDPSGGTDTSPAQSDITYAAYLKLSEAKKKEFNAKNPAKFAAFLNIGKKAG